MPLEIPFNFPLTNGMHARPASRLQDVAGAYRSTITFVNRRTGARANGKSTLALVATLTRQGDSCALLIEGEDEQEALRGMRRFITEEFPGCDDETSVPEQPREERALPRALRGDGIRVERGIGASPGIGRAPAVLLGRSAPAPPPGGWPRETEEVEIRRLRDALARVSGGLRERMESAPRGVEHDILKAHLSIASDPEFAGGIEEMIRTGHRAAGDALIDTARRWAETLSSSESAYLRERVLDIEDVAARLIGTMYGTAGADEHVQLAQDAICVAEALPPSEFLALGRTHLRGLVLERGGPTSHTAILARAFGVPCVSGVAALHRSLRSGEELIVDGERGLVVVAPTEAAGKFYEREAAKLSAMRRALREHALEPGVSADGRKIEIAANAASAEEAAAAFAGGAEGIGLFRTEMLFMGREDPPGEDEQYAVYAALAKSSSGRPVIIRTLDIGGDKPVPSVHVPPEENPFLGYRAVRLYADHPALIDAQLRAILRASAHGNLRIMFPMICAISEIRAMKDRIRALMAGLEKEGAAFNRAIEIGIMVEIPSLAFIMDQLSREVDFFSIGSNDLAQYFLAVDRANRSVAGLYTPFHPSFLRLLKQIIDGAHRHGKWIGLCGEMGGSALAAPLFLGYGIDEISAAPSLIPAVKSVVRSARSADCEALLASAMAMESPGEVEAALRGFAASLRGTALVTEETVRLSSQCVSKEEAIRALVDMLHAVGRVSDPDAVEDAVWAREQTYPTGMGHGVAIPHCKSPAVGVNSIAVLRLDAPVPWAEPGGDPARFLILIAIAAAAQGEEHLKIIAGLARRLVHEDFRERLLGATSARAIVDLLQENVSQS